MIEAVMRLALLRKLTFIPNDPAILYGYKYRPAYF